jgi:hypothetical protein
MLLTWEGEGDDPVEAAAISKEMKERLTSFRVFAKDAFTDGKQFKDDTGCGNNGAFYIFPPFYPTHFEFRALSFIMETNGQFS